MPPRWKHLDGLFVTIRNNSNYTDRFPIKPNSRINSLPKSPDTGVVIISGDRSGAQILDKKIPFTLVESVH